MEYRGLVSKERWMECKGNVLVVDDEIGPLESIRMIMKPYYNIVTADSGKAALQWIAKESFDLVTLDLNMSDMHGIEVLKRIKEQDEDVQVVIVTGNGTLSTAQQSIRHGAFDYLTKPFNIPEMLSVASKAIRKKRLQENMRGVIADLQNKFEAGETGGKEGLYFAKSLTAPLGKTFSLYQDLNLIDFIEVLSRTLEEKNATMHHHSKRVDHYSRVVAETMGLSDEDQEHLRIASFLHDIGKVGISNDILNKDGALTALEWKEIKDHPHRGVEIVKPLSLPQEVLSIILHHHESFQGGGYPSGIKGSEIPLCARIIRIADSYDAMISNRPYREARNLEWVMNEFRQCAGSHFDPEITDVFVKILSSQKIEMTHPTPILQHSS